jgi:hypothetical protein
MRHDLMLNEYPKKFVDSVMKPSTRNHPSSDTIYQGNVIIPYVKGTSEKFRLIGNRFNLRTIFKNKHALHVTLMKTGPVRDAHQTKQCVYSIPCDCGICYIGETSRTLEVRINEHKYNLTAFALKKKQNLPNMHTKKVTTYAGVKQRFCKLNQTPHTGNTRNPLTCL